MRYHKPLVVLSLAFLALLLSACGPVAAPSWAGLASDGELAYVAHGQQVHAVDMETGRQVWAFPQTRSNTTGVFVSEPGLGSDVIVVGSEGPTGSYSGILYGLDLANGQLRWCLAFDRKGVDREGCRLAAGGPAPGLLGLTGAIDNRIVGGLAVEDDVVYFGLANGSILAVDAATGEDLWRFEAERDIWATPLVNGERVYVASLDHNLYALDRQTGAVAWVKDMGGALAGTPLLLDGVLYVGTFGDAMHALDAATGEPRWPAYTTGNWVWSGPAEMDGILYFTDVSGDVYALDAASGQAVWPAVRPGALIRARPAVSDGALFVGDRDGFLFALNRANGTQLWAQEIRGQLLVTPILANDAVIVAPFNGDNLLAAYAAGTGQFIWAFAPSP